MRPGKVLKRQKKSGQLEGDGRKETEKGNEIGEMKKTQTPR